MVLQLILVLFINIKDSFKRAIASFNPFAIQQVATSDRIAVGARQGARWYFPDVLSS